MQLDRAMHIAPLGRLLPGCRGDARSDLSHRHRFGEYALANPVFQSSDCHHINGPAEEIGQLRNESAKIKQTTIRLQFDEEIDVARFVGLSACDGTEHSYISGPIMSCDRENV